MSQIGFDLEGVKEEEPSDDLGHGTALGSLIRMVAPEAGIDSLRVMRRGERLAESSVLINAVNAAINQAGRYHIVTIAFRASISASALGQRDGLSMILDHTRLGRLPSPVVVCAAGNDGPQQKMDYPAIVPGVVVATALDWLGRVASYNCAPPSGVDVCAVSAPGGVPGDPLGTLTRARRTEELWGSSFAAALISAALAS
ncbi:S8 family serine peptidase [Kitasatospora sp. NPDC127111]|uniref:S8 family serine peptidase n=1 Tax=Kitasatospora sp. NPDC127111 TaxID=3345363 RepID=UPI0036301789